MKKYFISGLIVLLPVVITISIANFFINLLTKPFSSAIVALWGHFGYMSGHWAMYISKILVLVAIAVCTVAIGFLAHGYIARKILHLVELLVFKIPFVSTVYRASRDVIHTVLASKATTFKEVVLVPFPHEKSYSLGFLVREDRPIAGLANKAPALSVFVPTTPNPTTGFIVAFQKDQVISTGYSVEEALKYIISCGVIQPDSAKLSPAQIVGNRDDLSAK